jgi:hypothetical protein
MPPEVVEIPSWENIMALIILAKNVPIGRIFRNDADDRFFVKLAFDSKANSCLVQNCDDESYWQCPGDQMVRVLDGENVSLEEELRRLGLLPFDGVMITNPSQN